MGSTYEAMVALFGSGISGSIESMKVEAIQARGGHCFGCGFCSKLKAIRPVFLGAKLRSDNFSVQVSCTIDSGRKNPFRKEGSKREDCPSSRRHQRRQSGTI